MAGSMQQGEIKTLLKSMTSFGQGQAPLSDGYWQVELRTVNSRFLDCHFRLPSFLNALEDRIKKYLSARFTRGRVNFSITLSGCTVNQPHLILNKPLLQEYKRIVEELRQELGFAAEVDLASFLTNRDIVIFEENQLDLEALWQSLEPALDSALTEAEAMRSREGEILADDFLQRLQTLEQLFAQVMKKSPLIVEDYRLRLEERITKLLAGPEPNLERLAQEVAIMADKCDIMEESVRAQSHIKQFREFLNSNEPVGRKLDFLVQELNREANTMGSKSPDALTAQLIVEIKTELERIREQVQNIE